MQTDMMGRIAPIHKEHIDPEHQEAVQNDISLLRQAHYRPQSETEAKLDKRLNRKLDLIVLSLLAVEFIVSHCNVHRHVDSGR